MYTAPVLPATNPIGLEVPDIYIYRSVRYYSDINAWIEVGCRVRGRDTTTNNVTTTKGKVRREALGRLPVKTRMAVSWRVAV